MSTQLIESFPVRRKMSHVVDLIYSICTWRHLTTIGWQFLPDYAKSGFLLLLR